MPTNSTETFTTPGITTYTIGTSGTYDITADGAQGGASTIFDELAGAGAAVGGDVYLQAGTKLEIVVGGKGVSAAFAGGGGGGSFVIEPDNGDTILAVAGGGGGGGYFYVGGFGGTGPTGGNGSGGAGGGEGGAHGAAGQGGGTGGAGGGGGSYLDASFTAPFKTSGVNSGNVNGGNGEVTIEAVCYVMKIPMTSYVFGEITDPQISTEALRRLPA